MEETNWLLTDEFIEFAEQIKDIHDRKKAKRQELKEFYDHIQVELRALDAECKAAEKEFSDWKNSQQKVSGLTAEKEVNDGQSQ
jgi:hypothetical protein